MKNTEQGAESLGKFSAGSWGIWLLVGLALLAITAVMRGRFDGEIPRNTRRILSDAASLPGVLLTGIGILGRIAQSGTYDIFGYTAYTFRQLFRPHHDGICLTYADYRQNRREAPRRRSAAFPVGMIFLAVGMVLGWLCER